MSCLQHPGWRLPGVQFPVMAVFLHCHLLGPGWPYLISWSLNSITVFCPNPSLTCENSPVVTVFKLPGKNTFSGCLCFLGYKGLSKGPTHFRPLDIGQRSDLVTSYPQAELRNTSVLSVFQVQQTWSWAQISSGLKAIMFPGRSSPSPLSCRDLKGWNGGHMGGSGYLMLSWRPYQCLHLACSLSSL